jgi:RNA 2',3'-cyclic 3'-phosphodiesterase
MSRGATARLFVAVDPPVHVSEELAAWARAVAAGARAPGGRRADLRLLESSSLHLTLCFLGSRPVSEIDELANTVRDCAENACELSVGAPLWLPPRRPNALAVEIHDRSGELARAQERITASLLRASGWEASRRRFRPHITLARVRAGAHRALRPSRRAPSAQGRVGPGAPDRRDREQPLPATPRVSFTPEAIVLYRSWLAPDGATYEALASCTLAPAER